MCNIIHIKLYIMRGITMSFINPPEKAPEYVSHRTFYSNLISHEVGYNIYLPPDYEESDKYYPVIYHLHGWQGNESSDIWALEEVYKSRQGITVFVNGTYGYLDTELPLESMIITELIPYIERVYRIDINRLSRAVSGFSMGGGAAFYYAVKYPELFGSVTAYAATFHHYLHKDYWSIWNESSKPEELYNELMRDEKYLDKDSILTLVKQRADKIRGSLNITMHVGTKDILYCENGIMHMYLNSLGIAHEFKTFEGVEHELGRII